MVPGKWPARIVQTFPGSGTMVGDGDTLVDENGNRWRRISEAEANLLRSGTATSIAHLATIKDGKIY